MSAGGEMSSNERNERNEAAIKYARKQYAEGSDDNIEIDFSPKISPTEGDSLGGVWVQAWVWVSDEDINEILHHDEATCPSDVEGGPCTCLPRGGE